MKIDMMTQESATFYTVKTKHEGFVEGAYMIKAGQTQLKEAHRYLPWVLASLICRSTKKHSEQAVNEMLEAKGIVLSASVNADYLIYYFTCLSEDLDVVLKILAEQIFAPAFKQSEWEALRERLIAKLHMKEDNTNHIANTEFVREVYPKDSINYLDTPKEGIKALQSMSLEQIKAYHASFDAAIGTWVAAGDLDENQFTQSVAKYFKVSSKQALTQQYKSLPIKPRVTKSVHKELPGKESISIRMGQVVDIDIHHVDYFPLKLAVDALGGSFSARLMRTVRDEDGLTYSVGSLLSGFAKGEVGSWAVYGTFSPKLLDQGISSIQKQLQLWKKDGITQEELDERKQGMIGRYKVAQCMPSQLVTDIISFLSLGYGPDEVIQYPKRLEAVTLAQVNAVIKTYIDLDKMLVATAGTKK